MSVIIFVVLGSLSLLHSTSAISFQIPPETVSSLDPAAYLGRWYEMYTTWFPKTTFERNGFCVVADYTARTSSNGYIEFEVINSQNSGSPQGNVQQVVGSATNENPSQYPGKFQVELVGRKSPYWVIALGPKAETDTQYPWAAVSTPFGLALWILARNVTEFEDVYEADVLQQLTGRGFNYYWNRPIKSFQSSSECVYPAAPSVVKSAASYSREKTESSQESLSEERSAGEIEADTTECESSSHSH